MAHRKVTLYFVGTYYKVKNPHFVVRGNVYHAPGIGEPISVIAPDVGDLILKARMNVKNVGTVEGFTTDASLAAAVKRSYGKNKEISVPVNANASQISEITQAPDDLLQQVLDKMSPEELQAKLENLGFSVPNKAKKNTKEE